MPIIAPAETSDPEFFARLERCGAAVIDEDSAQHQDIRPARIGLLNLMPAAVMEDTELRWLRFISHTVLQIDPVLLKFDNDCRDTAKSKRQPILKRYEPFSEARERGLDALIISGDNQELRPDGTPQPFDELSYGDELTKVIDWADQNVPEIIYSCLASHFTLQRRHGVEPSWPESKTFGVYAHQIMKRGAITRDMDDEIVAPHSRWGNVEEGKLSAAGIDVIASNADTGWLLAQEATAAGGHHTYIQGHPEYWRNDLKAEHDRDNQQTPANYYPNNDREMDPMLTWSNDARALFNNWISKIYANFSQQ